jgi:hypothetical protein
MTPKPLSSVLLMGFDLTAKNPRLGDDGYFRASVYQMILLRSSMLAAGVKEILIYRKFAANDGFFVTRLQSQQIAGRLRAWLKDRNLTLDLAEQNEEAKKSSQAYFQVFLQLCNREDKRIAKHFSKSKSLPLNVNPGVRKVIRGFAGFCAHSGGFWVE